MHNTVACCYCRTCPGGPRNLLNFTSQSGPGILAMRVQRLYASPATSSGIISAVSGAAVRPPWTVPGVVVGTMPAGITAQPQCGLHGHCAVWYCQAGTSGTSTALASYYGFCRRLHWRRLRLPNLRLDPIVGLATLQCSRRSAGEGVSRCLRTLHRSPCHTPCATQVQAVLHTVR